MKFRTIGVGALLVCLPAAQAIVTNGDPNSDAYWAFAGGSTTYSGVVQILDNGGADCTGALFGSSRVYILTAAHCVTNTSGNALAASNFSVNFVADSTVKYGAPMTNISASNVFVNPSYVGAANGYENDIAVIQLSSTAPTGANSYSLSTNTSVIGQDLTLVGWGPGGYGGPGPNANPGGTPSGQDGNHYPTNQVLRAGTNTYDFYANGDPTHVWWDFDSGSAANNASCYVEVGPCNSSTGTALESSLSRGDSGGPSFINGLLVGVHSLATCATNGLGQCASPPDVGTSGTVQFDEGEFASDTQVSLYDQTGGFLTQFEGTSAPEPATWAMLAGGFAAVVGFKRRKR